MRAQPLAQLSGPLPMSDRLYPAGASPFSKVAAAARRKRDFRDAGFGRGCRTAIMGAKRTQDAPTAESAEVGFARASKRRLLLTVASAAASQLGLCNFVNCSRPLRAASAASSTSCCMVQPHGWSADRPPVVPAKGRAPLSALLAGCAVPHAFFSLFYYVFLPHWSLIA